MKFYFNRCTNFSPKKNLKFFLIEDEMTNALKEEEITALIYFNLNNHRLEKSTTRLYFKPPHLNRFLCNKNKVV